MRRIVRAPEATRNKILTTAENLGYRMEEFPMNPSRGGYNERGIPPHRKTILIDGVWRDGNPLPRKKNKNRGGA